MKMFDVDGKELPSPDSMVLSLDSVAGWPAELVGESVSERTAMCMSAVYRCVDYICDFLAGIHMYVWDKDARRRVTIPGLSHAISVRPNPYQTPAAFRRFMGRNLVLRGNAVAFILRDPRSGRCKELLPLPADCVRPKILEDGSLVFLYTHRKQGTVYCLDGMDVLHYMGPSRDGIWGESVLRYAAADIQTNASGREYEAAVYRNNSRPSGVLTTSANLAGASDVPDPDHEGKYLSKKENIRRAWERVHAGSANSFRVAVLDNGLDYKPINLSLFDAQFILAQDHGIANIARFFGIPLHVLMTGKESYASNEQNSLEFLQGKGLAMLRDMEEENTYKLLTTEDADRGWWVKYNLEDRLRADTKTRDEHYRTMRELGAYSVNDIRAKEDEADVPGGDSRYASWNYGPLERFEELSAHRNQ